MPAISGTLDRSNELNFRSGHIQKSWILLGNENQKRFLSGLLPGERSLSYSFEIFSDFMKIAE